MSCHQSLERFLGRQIKVLNHAFGRRLREESSARGLDELTIMHGRILGYLKYNQDRDVFQKDIEEAFNITRSSVTGVVKLMEQKGYIRRESVAGDAGHAGLHAGRDRHLLLPLPTHPRQSQFPKGGSPW